MELSFIVPPRFEGGCLRDFLRASGVSATLIKAVKNETGGFWVEDGPARTCDTVHAGQMVTFVLPPEKPTTVEPQDIPLTIAYESQHVMVLEKPAGMAVHPTLNYADGTLANAYMGLLRQRGQQGVFRPVNRIDKDTSGLVLCAKNAYAAPLLAKGVSKVYRAVLEGCPDRKEGQIDAPIDRAPGSIILRRVSPEGKPSHTRYTVEAEKTACAWWRRYRLPAAPTSCEYIFLISAARWPGMSCMAAAGSALVARRCTAPGWNSPNRVLKRRW